MNAPGTLQGTAVAQPELGDQPEEQYITTFFCRALYDYQTNDASSLSFRRGDIIEVLTQLESGWWDGLLGEERGWFPSNYVTVISDQEAEAALSNSDTDGPHPTQDDAVVDMAHTLSSVSVSSVSSMPQALSQSDRDGDWLDRDADFPPHNAHQRQQNGSEDYYQVEAQQPHQQEGAQHDFWVPQVGADGRIFYVNTQTGERANDLPMETPDDSDTDLVMGVRQSTSRSGVQGLSHDAGFGVPSRTRTPEPWVRRLADDGLSYYYVNRVDGTKSWTLPQTSIPAAAADGRAYAAQPQGGPSSAAGPAVAPLMPNRLRSDSAISSTARDRYNADRASVYSDDSDVIQPKQRNRSESSASVAKTVNGVQRNGKTTHAQPRQVAAVADLTPAEQLAKILQRTMSPNPPESPAELSNHVRDAITAVVDFLQSSNPAKKPDHVKDVNTRVLGVVTAVRNLLYATATPSGHIPSNLYPRGNSHDAKFASNAQALQTHLKAAHRKVAGTLSKLVLSALAMQYDPTLSTSDKPNRMESDAAELERSVIAFVAELQRFQQDNPSLVPAERKRLRGVFSASNVGPGLPGAGLGADWKGFGYAPVAQGRKAPQRFLRPEVINELKASTETMELQLGDLAALWRNTEDDRLQAEGRIVVAHLSAILMYVCDINVAKHVDVDAVRSDTGYGYQPGYLAAVERARSQQRTLELSVQALFDDAATLLAAIQAPLSSDVIGPTLPGRYDYVDALARTILTNLNLTISTLESLWMLGQNQAELAQTVYSNSIEWRQSRGSVFYDSVETLTPGGILEEEEDVVDMELAFSRPGIRTVPSMDANGTGNLYHAGPRHASETSLDMSDRSRSEGPGEPITPTWPAVESSDAGTLVAHDSLHADVDLLDDEAGPLFDDEGPTSSKTPARGAKLIKLLGEAPQHYINKVNADSQPWYLRPNYDQSDILIDPDGSVRAGSKQALVERLTPHETAEPSFGKNFMITFKSFMTLDELFELLVQRFWISPPDGLNPDELEDWTKQKQQTIRLRVLNTFRTMINDEDILEKEDAYILDRIRSFCLQAEAATNVAAAKQLVVLIDRVQRGGDALLKPSGAGNPPAPPPITPKSSKKLKLIDIDPLELARQLTILEAQLYKKIRPTECLTRSREQRVGKNNDNIAAIIQLSNRIANWVAESVLNKEDSRKRAAVVKHFISVADRCRALQNFSSMVAITSGLNTPAIRRLKRTWEQVNQRFMSQLHVCESTIDSNKNFNNYRSLLARITPPCVPFIGTYLTTLTFINDGAEDKVAGHMINFRKRQKAAEVIRDIKQWQSTPYNFATVAVILSYLEDSLDKYSDGVDYGDQFWNLSLEREPREREDEKMARLLQESGFL